MGLLFIFGGRNLLELYVGKKGNGFLKVSCGVVYYEENVDRVLDR